jgi:hypothetical protein
MYMYSILSVPFYDARVQQYTKILCVNAVPPGPLACRVKTLRPPRLSGLSGLSYGGGNQCIHALHNSEHGHSTLMTPDDLPELFAFLASNGYAVDLGLTKLAAKHQSGGNTGASAGASASASANASANANSLVCIIAYNNSNTIPVNKSIRE